MKKCKCLALILTLSLIFSIMNSLVVQPVSATSIPMILPFDTSWELKEGQTYGRADYVDYSKDFSSPELDDIDNQIQPPPPNEVFGYDFGKRQLRAAGRFDFYPSYCYFSLFDMTLESDARPSFKIKPHTFISIFYYHVYETRCCMIDAQLYNSETQQYRTLRDFNHDGKYIVDQNGVRIHPAYRYDDSFGSWQFASFDLSIIYESNPNWYVTKIWIGFDNGISQKTGQAITYFDLLAITYGVTDKTTHIVNDPVYEPFLVDNAWVTASIETWECFYRRDGKYDLQLKVAVSGFDDGYCVVGGGLFPCNLYPYILKISTNAPGAHVEPAPKPTGVNLTESSDKPSDPKPYEFLLAISTLLIKRMNPELATGLTALNLASKFFGLLQVPEEEPTYEWPAAHWGEVGSDGYLHLADWDPKNVIAGEVYIEIPGLSRGPHSFTFTFTVDYYYKDPNPPMPTDQVHPLYRESLSLPLTIEWSTEPDDVNLPPETPSKPSGSPTVYVDTTPTYSTSTWDPNSDPVEYLFDWDDGSTTWPSTGSASHSWSSSGTYDVTVKAQDPYGLWSGLSPPLTVTVIKQNTPVGHWRFDEGSGSTAGDSSPYGNHGTIYGTFWTPGKVGYALSFYNGGDYVWVNHNPSLNFGNDSFTIALWVYWRGYAGGDYDRIAEKTAHPNQWWCIDISPNGQVEFESNIGSLWGEDPLLEIHRWVHLAMVIDRANNWFYLYKNGQLHYNQNMFWSGSLDSSNPLVFAPGGEFNGLLDEIRIYKQALSAEETKQLAFFYLTVLAEENGNSLNIEPNRADVYIDEQWCNLTGSTFLLSEGTHTVRVDDFWQNGTTGPTGYRYCFQHWEDGSTSPNRTITVVEPTTVTAYFYANNWTGDVDGDGKVRSNDILLIGKALFSQRGDPTWDSRCDLTCDGKVKANDIIICSKYLFKDYLDP